VLLLQFREQPHVLDGDRGLVGEGLEQGNLLLGKGTRLSLVGVDRADWQTIAQHWDGQNAPEVPDPGDDLDIVLRIFRHVGDLHDRPRQDTATGSRASARPARIHIANYLPAFRADVSLRDQVQQLAVERRYETAVGTTQAHHGPSDSIEDGLDVYRRT